MTGRLAALGFWMREIRQRRNREQAYQRAVNQANQQVAFIEGWLRTHQQLASHELREQARQRALDDFNGRRPWLTRVWSLLRARWSRLPLAEF